MNFSKIIRKLTFREEGQEEFVTPTGETAVFHLIFQDLLIGTLILENSIWIFQYDESFKNQNNIKPLLDFRDVNRVYRSESLYPFFATRIPGAGQLKLDVIKNEVSLLKLFGRGSISNPFILTSA